MTGEIESRPAPARAARTVLVIAGLLALGGCERERRSMREIPPGASAFPAVQTSELQAGPKTADPAVGAYQENWWAVIG